jgi:hypothetical protein
MDDTREQRSVPDSFFHRYFIRNAENRFVNDLKKSMLWREGRFPNPRHKIRYVQKFLETERENFHEKGEFHLPQIGFALTTRCTLLCRDCIALTPLFNSGAREPQYRHIDLGIDDFKRDLTALTRSVDSVKRLFLHGGEPLMNGDLPEMAEFAAACDKIELVEIITNGTIIPSERLLDAIAAYRRKIFFAMNSYKNPALKDRLKTAKITALLDERGIKHPLHADLRWYREEALKDRKYSPEQRRRLFENCWCKHSLQILDGKIAICPRASVALQLGLVETPPEDFIDLRKEDKASDAGKLRRELIAFYSKDNFAACGFCIPQTELVEPAIQMECRDSSVCCR